MLKEIVGDLVELAKNKKFDYICHGCNCQNNMGAGIAKQIAKEFPNADKIDKSKKWHLGEISITQDKKYKCGVINAYTQIWFGKANNKHFEEINGEKKFDNSQNRYNAIHECMKKINLECSGKSIGFPLIGCGLAGLSWNKVKKILEEELTNIDVTIVHFNG